MSQLTFKVQRPARRGKAIKAFQQDLKAAFKRIGIDAPVKIDGIYGPSTRSFVASLLRANGGNAGKLMKDGITPELRIKIRNDQYTASEKKFKRSKIRTEYRAALRKRWKKSFSDRVHSPVTKIISDDWGYHPGVHDGIDVITPPNAAVFAMVRAKVIDVRASGWWGKSPSGGVSKGDGIVQLEVLENNGPFRKGQHIGYGHVEHARVKKGQVVEAGEVIALVGFAVAWHIHLMLNNGRTNAGVGNLDPRKILDYSVKHG